MTALQQILIIIQVQCNIKKYIINDNTQNFQMPTSQTDRQSNQISALFTQFDCKLQQLSTLKHQLCLSMGSSAGGGRDSLNAGRLCAQLRKYVDEMLRVEIEKEVQKCKSQNMENVMQIILYYDKQVKNSHKCKIFYENEVADLQEEIKRQYKVIALMKQEVEDLMELVNYGNQSERGSMGIQQSENGRSSDRVGSNDLRMNAMNTSLDVIEEETQRTAMSSERSNQTNRQESVQKIDGPDASAVKEQGLAAHSLSYYMKIEEMSSSPVHVDSEPADSLACKHHEEQGSNHAIMSKQQRDSETNETFRKQKMDSISNRDSGDLIWPGSHLNSSVTKNHLQSIFFFQDEDSDSNRDQISLKHSIQSNLEADHNHSVQLSEQAYEEQEVLHYSPLMPTGSEGPITQAHISQQEQILSSSGQERARKIIQIDSKFLKSKSCKLASENGVDHVREDAASECILGDNASVQNVVPDQAIDSRASEYGSKPKTKQFLEEFRKTFNKCLHSMQAAKKHSTKNNIRHSQKSNGNLNNGQVTFGKHQANSMICPTDHVGVGKGMQRNRHDPRDTNRADKQNLKAIDLMLKELENNNKFVIGVKKLELKYEGEKKDGLRNGKGILYYSNGLAYEGEFVDGLRHGYGILKFNHIQIYNGDWARDEIEGQGKIRNCAIINKKKSIYSGQSALGKWISYSGEFRNSKFEGSGTLYLQGGEKFIGNFTGGSAYGAGIMYKKNGEVQSGSWKNNILVQKE